MRNFFHRLRTRQQPTATDLQDDLVDYHTGMPGATEATYGRCTTIDGRSSYDLLIDAAEDCAGKIVVDLACGNGPLIVTLLYRASTVRQIIGIDLCKADLALAQQRIGRASVELRCEAAQQLSLPSASVDIVLCHLAFMLFQPIEPVVQEIARVLKPGGIFASVISGMEEIPPLFAEVVQVLKGLVGAEHPHLSAFGWGDPRTWNRAGLATLFAIDAIFQPTIDVLPFTLIRKAPPTILATELFPFFYATDLLTTAGRSALVTQWTTLFERDKALDGTTTLDIPLTRVMVRKAPT